jgi:hypothetical protein
MNKKEILAHIDSLLACPAEAANGLTVLEIRFSETGSYRVYHDTLARLRKHVERCWTNMGKAEPRVSQWNCAVDKSLHPELDNLIRHFGGAAEAHKVLSRQLEWATESGNFTENELKYWCKIASVLKYRAELTHVLDDQLAKNITDTIKLVDNRRYPIANSPYLQAQEALRTACIADLMAHLKYPVLKLLIMEHNAQGGWTGRREIPLPEDLLNESGETHSTEYRKITKHNKEIRELQDEIAKDIGLSRDHDGTFDLTCAWRQENKESNANLQTKVGSV